MMPVTKKWLFLKISSFILTPLMIWFILNFINIYDKNHFEILEFFNSQPSQFLFGLFLVFAYFFSALSISEVFEDYIKNDKIKSVANKLLYASAVAIPLITIILISSL